MGNGGKWTKGWAIWMEWMGSLGGSSMMALPT